MYTILPSSTSERDTLQTEVDALKRAMQEMESAVQTSKDRESAAHKEVGRAWIRTKYIVCNHAYFCTECVMLRTCDLCIMTMCVCVMCEHVHVMCVCNV